MGKSNAKEARENAESESLVCNSESDSSSLFDTKEHNKDTVFAHAGEPEDDVDRL